MKHASCRLHFLLLIIGVLCSMLAGSASSQTWTNGTFLGNVTVDDDVWVNDRFHAVWDSGGRGAYAIEDTVGGTNTLADFSVSYRAGDYFPDSASGDVCLRSSSGNIRIGYDDNEGDYSTSMVVDTNGNVTVTSGALYLTPQGDLSMGSFTNSPPH